MKKPYRRPVRERMIFARCTTEERGHVDMHAKAHKVSVSELVRFAMAEYMRPLKRKKR